MKRAFIVALCAMLFVLVLVPAAWASGATTSSLPSGTKFTDPTVSFSFEVADPHGVKTATIMLTDAAGTTILSKSAKLTFDSVKVEDPESGEYTYKYDYTHAVATATFTGVQDRSPYTVKLKIQDRSYAYTTVGAGTATVDVDPKVASLPHVVYGSSASTTRFPFVGWDNSTTLALQGRVFNFGGTTWQSYGGPWGQVCWGGGIPPANGLVSFQGLVAGASTNGTEGYPVDPATLLPGIAEQVRRYEVAIRLQDNYPSSASVPTSLIYSNHTLYLAKPELAGDNCVTCHDKAVLTQHLDHCGACHGDGGPVGWMGADFPEYDEPVHDASVFENCVDCHHNQYATELPQCPVCP